MQILMDSLVNTDTKLQISKNNKNLYLHQKEEDYLIAIFLILNMKKAMLILRKIIIKNKRKLKKIYFIHNL